MRQVVDIFRKKPQQDRSGQTVDTLIDATIQILDKEGEGGLTTNRVAERAGFSVGTLYQYFRNKDALIQALADRELAKIRAELQTALAQSRRQDAEGVLRSLIQVLLRRLSGRHSARRALVMMFMRRGDTARMVKIVSELIGKVFAELRWHDDFPSDMDPMRFHVLTRAIFGAVRLTAVENPALLADPAFENELVWLGMCAVRQGKLENAK